MVVDEKLWDHQRYQYNSSWSTCHGTRSVTVVETWWHQCNMLFILFCFICWTDLTFCFVLFSRVWNTNVHSFMNTHSIRQTWTDAALCWLQINTGIPFCLKQGLRHVSLPLKTQPLWRGRTITPRYNCSMITCVPGYYLLFWVWLLTLLWDCSVSFLSLHLHKL